MPTRQTNSGRSGCRLLRSRTIPNYWSAVLLEVLLPKKVIWGIYTTIRYPGTWRSRHHCHSDRLAERSVFGDCSRLPQFKFLIFRWHKMATKGDDQIDFFVLGFHLIGPQLQRNFSEWKKNRKITYSHVLCARKLKLQITQNFEF